MARHAGDVHRGRVHARRDAAAGPPDRAPRDTGVRLSTEERTVAFDEALAERVRDLMTPHDGVSERKMFGGLSFMLAGNMCCGVLGEDLMVRVEPDQTEALLGEPHARRFDMSGRPMKGWLVVDGAGVSDDAALRRWVERGVAFAASLPAKG